MSSSHTSLAQPSVLLALICLCIVRRLRPAWVAVAVREAARAEGVNAERVSRLATRALEGFESVVGRLTRKGRPPESGDDADNELALTRALLGVATSILEHVKLRKDVIRGLLVGCYLHLRATHPQLTQKRFCQTLAVPARTLRSWLENQPMTDIRSGPIEAETGPPRKRARPPRRGRFGFAVTIPDTQVAGDTTALRAFGVPLKLIATQDVGGRERSLLDAVIVDVQESADHVVGVLRESLASRPGAQFLSDQGTPYLAARTRQALDELQAEHAVQKEGDPLGKATIERAFGTVKRIASPILGLTDRLAGAFPCLEQPDLAIAATTLILTALLRAYQAGARAAHRADAERPSEPDELARVAEQSRERARADDRSARLLLTHIHGAYDIDCPLRDFIRRFRRFPVTVLREAERTFAAQAHRTDINNRTAYFAKLVRVAEHDYRRQRAREDRDRQEANRLAHHHRRVLAERAAWYADPTKWLDDVLTLIAEQWNGQTLLFDGAGVLTWLRQSLARLEDLYGPLSADVVASVFCRFEQNHFPQIGTAGVAAVKAVLERHHGALPTVSGTPFCAPRFVAMLMGTGSNPRPPPSPDPC